MENLSTGIRSLDRVFHGVNAGDNLVWLVFSIDDYQPFVAPYCENAACTNGNLVYLRFAKHRPLIQEQPGVETHQLYPGDGFEPFISQIHSIFERSGPHSFYLFDCLSDLAVDWNSDRMLGNLFMLTCPYVYDQGSLAYFALYRNQHSFHTTRPVTRTAQVVIDVYRHKKSLYIRPLKVEKRHSSSMRMLHQWKDNSFVPVSNSKLITEIQSKIPWNSLEDTSYRAGVWTRSFDCAEQAQSLMEEGKPFPDRFESLVYKLIRMLIGEQGRGFELAKKYLSLPDILNIRRRMVGTGPLGGKAVGMLLAQAILRKADQKWEEILEPHDSFYIGADVFYTYLVQNGLWWIKQKQKNPDEFLSGIELARHQMLNGTFPDYIIELFGDMLDYYGASPIAIRSSSLLEDGFESTLAGKAKSVFCSNQGSRDERLDALVSAVRTVYSSSMSEQSLKYRAAHGLLGRDEQMAILVQRVSGEMHERKFFSHIAGVGLSFNPYVWNESIDPHAGVLRLVFGLGTKAVDPPSNDYIRIVALNDPMRQTESSTHSRRRNTQRKVDVLDMDSHERVALDFEEVVKQNPEIPLHIFATIDEKLKRFAEERKLTNIFPWTLTFQHLLEKTDFVANMREMLAILQNAYACPVDVEFAANFLQDGSYTINLLQCRPMRATVDEEKIDSKIQIISEDRILESSGPMVGFSRKISVDQIIYVKPSEYSQLSNQSRYQIAKIVSRLTNIGKSKKRSSILLIGPGRWGTTMPSLGVPVSFSEIKNVSAICEIVEMHEGLVPDVSLGTHFFNEIVETNILYFALYPDKEKNFINKVWLESSKNRLTELLPEAEQHEQVIHVIDAIDLNKERFITLYARTASQTIVCYLSS